MATVTSALSAVITDPPQRTVEAPLGSSLTLNCSFEPQTSAWVRWYFNINQSCSDSRSSQLSSHKISVNTTVEQNDGGHFLQESGRAWSRLTVRDVWYNDSGWYFCWVQADIPYLRNSNSNGTQVIISKYKITFSSDTSSSLQHVHKCIVVIMVIFIIQQ